MACDIPKYEIRPLKEAELPQVRELMCQVHGWESYDKTFASTLFDIDPNGCLAAVTSTGEVLSKIYSYLIILSYSFKPFCFSAGSGGGGRTVGQLPPSKLNPN